MDGGHRRHGGVRDRDHLVARSDAAGGEREVKRLGAAADADGPARSDGVRELLLEGLRLRAQDVASRLQDARDGGVDLGLVGAVLSARIAAQDHAGVLNGGAQAAYPTFGTYTMNRPPFFMKALSFSRISAAWFHANRSAQSGGLSWNRAYGHHRDVDARAELPLLDGRRVADELDQVRPIPQKFVTVVLLEVAP
jgi:hypothetical protein